LKISGSLSKLDAFCYTSEGLYVKSGVVRIHTEHNYRCNATSDDSKAQKTVTYRDKKIPVMQHGLKTANFILEKNVDSKTLGMKF